MSPPAPRPHDEDPRRRILVAAAAVFAERGFAGAGVDEIARRAGVNKAMLYYHVGDKATLYATVLGEFVDRLLVEARARVDENRAPAPRLRSLQRAFLTVLAECPDYPPIMLREIAAGGATLPAEVLARMAAMMSLTRSIVEEGRASGEFRPVHPILAHLVVVSSALFVAAAQRLRPRLEAHGLAPGDVPTDLGRVADELTEIILDGIAVSPSPGGKR